MTSRILGIDVGTSAVKIGLFTEEMELINLVRRSYLMNRSSTGEATQKPNDWWNAILDGLLELKQKNSLEGIETIGLSGFNAMVGLDKSGAPCGEALTYQDSRPGKWEGNRVTTNFMENVFQASSNPYTTAGTWAPMINWKKHNQPDEWKRTDKFVSSSGYIIGKLTGHFGIDRTRAALSLLYNSCNEKLCWDHDLCEMFQVGQEKLPQIWNSWDIVGTVQEEAARQTGLKTGIPVIAGGIDSLCAALGVGLPSESNVLDIGGSAGGLIALHRKPGVSRKFWTTPYVLPDFWATIGPMNNGGSGWQWFINTFNDGKGNDDFISKIIDIAPGADGLRFVPFLSGTRAPFWNMDLRAGFHGVTIDHTIAHFGRAVMEGIIFCQKDILSALQDQGYEILTILSAGGPSENPIWLQLKSNILGLPYCQRISESACYGAAIIAGIGSGILPKTFQSNMHFTNDHWIYPNPTYHSQYLPIYQSYQRVCQYHLNEVKTPDFLKSF